MKKAFKVIGITLCLIVLTGIVFLLINKSYSKVSLKVNILENEVYYSDSFEVSKNTIQVYSNMDCAIEIVNADDDSDSVSIGYLTPGMSESIKLSKNKKYRIRSDVDSDKLVITIKGAKETGKEVELIDLAHTDIHPCMGCDYCGMNGDCVQKDKGNEILNKIIESDAIVFASPVYYYNVSAQLKILIDRFYAKTMKITNRNLKAEVIMTAWNDNDWTYDTIDKYFDILFDYMHFKDSGRIYGKGCGTVPMIPKKYYEEAYNLGKSI